MRLYLDDDTSAALLLQVLRKAGHDAQAPADVGLAGRHDAEHLAHCIRERRACLTRNYHDFECLHLLVLQGGGHHPGILVVRRDDDPRRNMSPHDNVRALRNLESAGVPIADEYIILNAWQ